MQAMQRMCPEEAMLSLCPLSYLHAIKNALVYGQHAVQIEGEAARLGARERVQVCVREIVHWYSLSV